MCVYVLTQRVFIKPVGLNLITSGQQCFADFQKLIILFNDFMEYGIY